MRFKKPDDGDVRIKEKFLLFPLMINREIRWLEFANGNKNIIYAIVYLAAYLKKAGKM